MELLAALSRLGISHYKSHDLEIRLGGECQRELVAPEPLIGPSPNPPVPIQNEDATKKLTDLIETLKMNDESLVDKIFPAGAGL